MRNAQVLKHAQASVARNIEAEIFIPSRSIGFVKAGQRVALRFHAYPYQKHGVRHGSITQISATPIGQNELPSLIAPTVVALTQRLNSGGGSTIPSFYRARIALDPSDTKPQNKSILIRPGLTAEVDIVQDERKLWEWIFEPALGISARL